jgi:DNA uptake protein ComE-like DNA-binding protein
MNLRPANLRARASTFVVVLWIAFGLVGLTLYFGQNMSFELRASDNRVSAMAAEQAIEGAARYAGYVLANQITNGYLPDPTTYLNEAVRVGDARFWFIGRDTNYDGTATDVSFGLVDEAGRLNLNSASSNELIYLPGMSLDLAAAVLEWRSTNGNNEFQMWYGMHNPPYVNKSSPFETTEELRLLFDADFDALAGEDANRNGVLDPNESDLDRDGNAEPGLLEYVTVWSREPNTYSNGTARINISSVSGSSATLVNLLQGALGNTRGDQVLANLGLLNTPGGGGGGPPGQGGQPGGGGVNAGNMASFSSLLQFYRRSGMTIEEFGLVADALTVTNGSYIDGRVNVNTASEAVLSSLPGVSQYPDLARAMVDYRRNNPTVLGSIAWVVEAIGQSNSQVLDELETVDCLTVRSYQFSADIAAVGPHGRGYRRVRYVFDTLEGKPRIIYRQDLTHLGWALGKQARKNWVLAKDDSK